MKKIQYSVYKRDTGNASGKAKKDCLETLERMGFEHLYHPSDTQTIRVLQQFVSLLLLSLKKEKKVFVFQYPAVYEKFYPLIIKTMHTGDVTIAVIHDLLALQNDLNGEILQNEVDFLNHFKYVVVPNSSMQKLLTENSCKVQLINMEIYDYLHDNARAIKNAEFTNTVCFAGNLQKSLFLQHLDEITNIHFLLYGKDGDHLAKANAEYKGCLPADDLVYLLEGDYGLVWDGDSLDECSGTVGRYLLYNSPHKLSSYVAAGKPVITWDKAAISEYVKQHNIGIVVSSLKELESIELREHFEEYKKNVLKLKSKLATGYYLENALNEIFKVEGL